MISAFRVDILQMPGAAEIMTSEYRTGCCKYADHCTGREVQLTLHDGDEIEQEGVPPAASTEERGSPLSAETTDTSDLDEHHGRSPGRASTKMVSSEQTSIGMVSRTKSKCNNLKAMHCR